MPYIEETRRLFRPINRKDVKASTTNAKAIPTNSPHNQFLHHLLSDSDLSGPDSPMSSSPTSLSSMSAHTTNSISQYCTGFPRNVASSHSGSVTVALSLQEPTLFLGSAPSSSSSYQEAEDASVADVDVVMDHSAAGNSEPEPASPHKQSFPSPQHTNSNSNSNSISTSCVQTAGSNANPSANIQGSIGVPASTANCCFKPTILRGSVVVKVTKPTKMKSLSLTFTGMSRTVWTQSPSTSLMADDPMHQTTDIHDVFYINSHQWEFLPSGLIPNAKRAASSVEAPVTVVGTDLYGADNALFKGGDAIRTNKAGATHTVHSSGCKTVTDSNGVTIPAFKLVSAIKRKTPGLSSPINKETYVLPAGEYVYNFNLAIDSRIPESVKAPNGEIQYSLVAKVVRPGAFSMNISGQQAIHLVRSPPDGEAMTNNPIVVSRVWDNRLQYEICIPQKYVPLGTRLPIQIKLSPLEKVAVYRIRVMITESVEYVCSMDTSKRTTDRSLRVMLYEKKGETRKICNDKGEMKEKFMGSILTEGEGSSVFETSVPLLSSADDFDTIPQQYISSSSYAADPVRTLHPDVSSNPYIRIKHRLVFMLRISKQDEFDNKRRHFDVKIDTPITLLDKCCSGESVDLPLYDDMPVLGPWTSEELSSTSGDEDELPPSFDDTLLNGSARFARPLNHLDALERFSTPPPEYSTLSRMVR